MDVAWDKKTMLDSSGLPSQANAGVLFQGKKRKPGRCLFNLSTPKAKLKTDINTERLRQTQLCNIGKPEYFSLKYSKTTNCRKSSSKVIKARNEWKLSLDSRDL